MKFLGMLITVVVAFGCDAKIQPKMEASQVNLSKEACLDNPEYPGCTEYLGNLEADFTITHAKPLVADSGETVMIYGENLTEGLLIKVNGNEISANVISGTEASFVMPDGLTNGKVDALAQKYDKTKPFLLYAWVDGEYPLITEAPEDVCQGKKYYNAAGDLLEGAKDCGDSALACTQDGQVGCLTSDAFVSADKSKALPEKILIGTTIAGIAGGVDLSNLTPGNIKSGVVIANVTGDYPSATYPLTGADATADLDLATFDAKVKSATAFEWFSPSGTRYIYNGDANITAANIASGVTIFGTTGTLANSNCTGDGQTGCVTTSQYKSADTNAYSTWDIRKGKTVGGKAGDIVFYNMIGSYNNSTAPAVAGNDVWDTVDDYNNNGAFPTTAPSGWDQATGANWIMDPANDVGGGGGTASDNLCSGTEACVFKDQITGLMWAKDDGTTRTWQNSITYCDGLSYGGYTDWRLPTQKELMQAYTDGIWSQKAANKLSLTTNYYWSSSTTSDFASYAWVVLLNNGYTYGDAKTDSYGVACVR